ncbi:aminoglycoside adenylyltransferase family protein [Streptomyces mangrovi]|uniref:aminoglycoside adenylyltransferase family protein n=1 Tax=Streptomyces mangrovi TaxID=1206892 RepID=UPI00399C980C
MSQLQEAVELVDGVLGPTAVGVYLHGSSVLAGLRPASDIDLLVLSRRTMDERERQTLLEGLLEISASADAADDSRRPVELTVVVQSEIRPWRFPPTGDFLYGEWLRDAFEAGGIPRPEPVPDLALLLTTVLAGDHSLIGPRPAQVIDPVPHRDLTRASTAGIPDLLDELEDDTRNVVLTLARIWTTLATGEIASKDAAADWALARLPPEHRPVLEHARNLYLNRRYSEETWSDELRAQVRPHTEKVLTEISRLRQEKA